MIKIFLVFLSVITMASAKDYCIIAFSSPTMKLSDKELFMHRYPKSGTVEKYKNIYEYKIYTQQDFQETKKILKEVHKKYRDAFIINCESKTKKHVKSSAHKKSVKKSISKKVIVRKKSTHQKEGNIALKEHDLTSKKHQSIDASKVSNFSKTPELNEPQILQPFEIPKAYKNDKVQIYDNLTYQRYMNALFKHNNKVDEAFYQEKIDSILVEIKKDRYNFDVYTDGYIRTGRSVPAQGNGVNVEGDYTGAGVAIHADKLLWDGEYNLINNTYDILNNRLAQITEINTKEKLAILGTTIYSNLYNSQEELAAAKKIYEKQVDINDNIKNSFKSGKISLIAYIDSKNDLLQMKKNIMSLEQAQQHNDYILRHSIESKSVKPYKLSAPKIELDVSSLSELEKQALQNSSDIAIESNKLKVKKADLLYQQKRYYPEIRFNSFFGYGMGNLRTFDLSNAGTGEYWELGLQFKMPIYNKNDIRLNEEKEKYEIMKQKSIFSSKQREILILVDNYYKNIDRINQTQSIVKEQHELMDKKLIIAKEQFLSGIAQYRDYADASRDYLNYTNQYMTMQQQYIQSVSILSILVGKKEFYEQN